MEETYSIKKIVGLLLGKIWLLILLTVLGAGAAFSYAKLVMPLKYQSYTTMYVKNNMENAAILNNNDLNTARSLVSTYIAVLQSDTMLENTGDKLVKKFGNDRVAQISHLRTEKFLPILLEIV